MARPLLFDRALSFRGRLGLGFDRIWSRPAPGSVLVARRWTIARPKRAKASVRHLLVGAGEFAAYFLRLIAAPDAGFALQLMTLARSVNTWRSTDVHSVFGRV
jgi:hypothetical protein